MTDYAGQTEILVPIKSAPCLSCCFVRGSHSSCSPVPEGFCSDSVDVLLVEDTDGAPRGRVLTAACDAHARAADYSWDGKARQVGWTMGNVFPALNSRHASRYPWLVPARCAVCLELLPRTVYAGPLCRECAREARRADAESAALRAVAGEFREALRESEARQSAALRAVAGEFREALRESEARQSAAIASAARKVRRTLRAALDRHAEAAEGALGMQAAGALASLAADGAEPELIAAIAATPRLPGALAAWAGERSRKLIEARDAPPPPTEEETMAPTLTQTLAADATDAAWRTAGSQFVKLARDPLAAALCHHLGGEGDDAFRARAAAFLHTELGSSLLSLSLSGGLSAIPESAGPVPGRLAQELRVRALAGAGDALADVLTGPLRQVIDTYLRGQEPAAPPVACLPSGGRAGSAVEQIMQQFGCDEGVAHKIIALNARSAGSP